MRTWFQRRTVIQPPKHPRAKHNTRLCLEQLEDRLAPAVLTVNSLQDLAVDLSDATVTLRDAIAAAETDAAVSPGGPSGSGADTDVAIYSPTGPVFFADLHTFWAVTGGFGPPIDIVAAVLPIASVTPPPP